MFNVRLSFVIPKKGEAVDYRDAAIFSDCETGCVPALLFLQ